ncbi:MAG: ATP-binding protein [Rikenellaceae bacterium]
MFRTFTIYRYIFFIALFATTTVMSMAVESLTLPNLTEQYTTSDGLAINGVNAMCRDRKGYLWIATYYGLNRYNGHSFLTFNKENYPQSFSNNRIRSITEAPNGNIWIGTDTGVLVFDYNSSKFESLSIEEVTRTDMRCIVKDIFISGDKGDVYCVSERDGILIYDNDRAFEGVQNFIGGGVCYDAMELDKDILLLSTSKGIEYHNMKSHEAKLILSNEIKHANYIHKISPNLMIVALQNGVQMVEINQNGKNHTFSILGKAQYTENMFYTISIDEKNTLWLGTKADGVRVVELDKFGSSKATKSIMLDERISSMLFEQGGVKWVATFDHGVFRYDDTPNLFKDLKTEGEFNLGRVIQVLPYSNYRILIRSLSSQYTLYNIRDERIEPLPFSLTSVEMNNCRRIARDNKNRIWFLINTATELYLATVDTVSGSIKYLHNDCLQKIKAQGTYVMEFDNNNNLWICNSNQIYRITITEGLQIDNIESISSNPYFANDKVHPSRVVYADPNKNVIWIGSATDGLYRLEFGESNKIQDATIIRYLHDNAEPQSISGNTISAIHRAPDGTLWIGTEQGGLCRVDERGEQLSFQRYAQKQGLSNNVVKGIQSDHNGDLWVSTNIGLNHFSSRYNRFTIYRERDGIPFENFNYNNLKLPSGRMVFAGGSNIVHFNPVNLSSREERPNMWFSSLSINNKIVESGDEFNGRTILQKSLSNGDNINLKYNENVITIGVDVICKSNSDNYKIEYKLEPLSKEWTSILATSSKIQFDGLQPDTYTLSVRCCNFYGDWSTPQNLTFKISPPAWRTTAAYILYLVVLIIVLVVIIYVLLRFMSLKHQLQIEQISKQAMEVLNREKQRYFSNISHELKTPLTLILAPIAVLTEKFRLDVNVTKSLQVINRQSKKMLQLIELAHSVQLEADNLLELKPSIFDFKQFVDDITADFEYYAQSDNKTLRVVKTQGDVIVEADRALVEKIVNNLLSNAFKHTRQQDHITISYTSENGILTLVVEDSGYGIDKSDLPRIFERFYQAKKRGAANIGGTGIGLTFSQTIARLHDGEIDVESEFGKGTKFTVRLPIVVDTSLYDFEQGEEMQSNKPQDMESALILGDMNIESISVREDLQDSLVYLVEDNPDMRTFLEGIIAQFYKVKSYSNGVECLEAMKSGWPDIILSDVMMPQMDGYELCSAIKNNPLTSHIPVIMLTACSTIDEKIKGLSCGADSYIPKPFYPKHTITRIDALLYNRKKLRERFLVDDSILKGPTSGNRDNKFMNDLYKIFSDNLSNEEIDIDNIATEMGVSRTLFFQKIKAITNDSPYELLKNYRLKRAAEYLSMGDVQVNEVSFLVGFKSRTHFSKLFKDKYGHTPGKYAKLAKSGELE